MTPRHISFVLALALGPVVGAADGPVPAEWPAIDKLVEVDLLTLDKLKKQIVVDMETGAGSDHCPKNPWTGRATYVYPDGEEIVYFGTGIYCAPVGYGRVEYSDGRVYTGQVNSFLASPSATLTQDQFRPAVRHGNGRLERKGGTTLLGRFERGAQASDRSKDEGFLKALDSAERSLPDRYAPLMTSAVAAFGALPPGGAPVAAGGEAFANVSKGSYGVDDSIASAGAAVVAAADAAQASVSAPVAAATTTVATSAGSIDAGHSGGGLVTTVAPVAANFGRSGGALALPAPLPENFRDQSGMFGFPNVSAEAAAQAKPLTKEFELSSRGNGIMFGAGCPKAGFLGLKPWRARVVYTQTFSGRIVYDGVGLGCGSAGPGRVEFEDGSVYEGQTTSFMGSVAFPLTNFEPAVPSGAGKFTFPDGTAVEGTWTRGELNGGPIVVTRPGAQPEAYVTGTLASLRAGGLGAGSSASYAAAPSGGTEVGAAKSMGGIVAPAGGASMQAVAGVAAAGLPFTPAGAAGLPFTPAGAGGQAAVEGGPGKAGPQPMLGSTGKYLCPYTEDGVVALWVDKAIKARMGGAIGGMVGAEAGKELFKNIPMFGGMFGKMAGDKMGREVAIKMAGGWEYIRANTDQSFDNVYDYVTWMRANYAGTEHYSDVVAAIKELYPELKTMQF